MSLKDSEDHNLTVGDSLSIDIYRPCGPPGDIPKVFLNTVGECDIAVEKTTTFAPPPGHSGGHREETRKFTFNKPGVYYFMLEYATAYAASSAPKTQTHHTVWVKE
jgi:hypothetical protein